MAIWLYGQQQKKKKKRELVGEVERKLRPLWLILPELRRPVRTHLVTTCLAKSTMRTKPFFSLVIYNSQKEKL
jgi:hypothetical protein